MVKPTHTGAPLPMGYVEVQSSWVESDSTPEEIATLLQELIGKTLREQPHLKHYSTRIEFAPDGGSLRKVNLYVGFEPKHTASEPLDPGNLGSAPLPQPGAIGPTDGVMPLGHKENQFGRGT